MNLQTAVNLNYRPQTKFAKVMFSQVSVCPQSGGGGCLPHCRLGYALPWEQTTPRSRHPRSRHPPSSRQPPQQQTLSLQCMLGNMGSKRVVRIPLEYILVEKRALWKLYCSHINFFFYFSSKRVFVLCHV